MSALPFSGSAVPYGSAAPYGTAYPAPIYGGSAYPSAYQTGYPSYDAGIQSFPTFNAPAYPSYSVPEATPIPAPKVSTSNHDDIVERRKRTDLEKQLEIVKELELQLESAVHELELEHVKLNQNHSGEYNSLFQQQTAVFTAQSQKVINAINDVPVKYLGNDPSRFETKLEFPPAGSSLANSQSTQSTQAKVHPMQKMQELQSKIIALRKHLDAQVLEHKNRN